MTLNEDIRTDSLEDFINKKILSLASLGKTDDEIAESVSRGKRCVQQRILLMTTRYNLKNRTNLVCYAIRKGVIE